MLSAGATVMGRISVQWDAAVNAPSMSHEFPDTDEGGVGGERSRLLNDLEDGMYDHANPEDFRTVLYIAILYCLIPPALIADMFGMAVGTVWRWLSGDSEPATIARWAIFNAIIKYLKENQ